MWDIWVIHADYIYNLFNFDVLLYASDFAHEKTFRRNAHNSSDRESRRTRRLRYKHTFWQNFVPTKNYFCLYFRITCLRMDQLRIYQVFLSPVKLRSADYDRLLFYERYLTILVNLLFILFVWWNCVWNCGPSGASVRSAGGRWMNVVFCGMINGRGNRRRASRRKFCSYAALCSPNPTWTALGLKQVASHLSCGTVYCKRSSVVQGSYPWKRILLPALTFKELKEFEISDS
jgi:hypothetical protein